MDYPVRLDNKERRDEWNDDIEQFFSSSRHSIPVVKKVDDDAVKSSLEAAVLKLQSELVPFSECEECNTKELSASVRTGKNLLRWFIQIYLDRKQGCRTSNNECTIDLLRSLDVLKNVVDILKWSIETKQDIQLAIDSSQFIFYASYNQFGGDKIASAGMNYLLKTFPQLILETVMETDSVHLSLSLVRNLHSMVVQYPGASDVILDTQMQWNPSTATISAPWAPKEGGPSIMNISLLCLNLIIWSLEVPSFPGKILEDKRGDIVVEILNLFYALRKGQELKAGNCDDVLANITVSLLTLKVPTEESSTDDDIFKKRIEQCKSSTVSLLMDSGESFGQYLLEVGSLECLLQILERQVNDVVDNTRIDSAATAAIVPILVVMNRYSMANADVLQKVKSFVFPNEIENIFKQAMKENRKTKMKMSPLLDAPKETLRGKFIILLSWVDGYIKRCSAELMWTLCGSDSFEYTCRVGLGNALPMLNARGLSPLSIPT